jgi:hypothetical protein
MAESPYSVLQHLIVSAFFVMVVGVVYQMLTGRIVMAGLLSNSSSLINPERVVLLCISVSGAVWYATLALSAFSATAAETYSLPEVPEWLMGAVGATNLAYLTGKSMRS